VLVFRDITDRRRAEDERATLLGQEQEARTRAEAAQRRIAFLAEASAVLASSLDYEATLQAVARLAVPYLADWCAVDVVQDGGTYARLAIVHGEPDKEKIARELQRRFPPAPAGRHGVSRVALTGQPEFRPEIDEAELEATVPDPEQRALIRALGLHAWMCVPLLASGRCLGAITLVQGHSRRRYDPDDLALAEALARRASLAIENARLYREAQAANRAKDEFLATLSHELRTPLNAMLGWATILRAGSLDGATVERGLGAIERNTRVLVQLIDELLDVSRIISGKLRVDVRPVDLLPVIEAAVEATRTTAEAKDIRLDLALDPGIGPVPGDPDRLQQVVWNLLANAIKFTPRGGRVQVHLDRAGSRARIQVIDTGKGIAPEFLPYVFDRFRQAESVTTREHGGLGLGLAIVRHLVDIHGGRVSAASAGEGRGSVFTVELPIRVTAVSDPEPEWSARGRVAPGFAAPPVLEGLRLLVVDDDPDARDLLTTIFTQCRAIVTSVGSTAEALAVFQRQPIDVLISDIGLPGDDGYALIRKVRALEASRGGRVPAVALTAYARSEDRKLALLAGFHMHVAKPVQPVELVSVVATVATLRRSGEAQAAP
jgi:signal transduction histidine kinase/CheY-like chemotaxis protein